MFDVNQPDKRARRTRGKTEILDAEAAARAVLSGRRTAVAKIGTGLVEAMRLLKLARDSAVNARTKGINQLKAVIVDADPQLRESLAGLGAATFYTTNAIESLNARFRQATRQRGHFPTEQAALRGSPWSSATRARTRPT